MIPESEEEDELKVRIGLAASAVAAVGAGVCAAWYGFGWPGVSHDTLGILLLVFGGLSAGCLLLAGWYWLRSRGG